MKTDFFLDNESRIARKLLKAEDVRLQAKPACYIIENKETEKIYVGSTKNITRRINKHRQMLLKNQHSNTNLQKEFNDIKNTDNLIIHVCPTNTVDEALDREQLILDEGYESGLLLNKSDNARSPNSGYDRSEAIKKITEHYQKTENKIKQSKISSDRWKNEESRQKMINAMGDNIIVDGIKYGSVRQASRETGVGIKTIRDRLINNECTLDDIRPSKKAVICDGKKFNSVTEAADAYGIKTNTMIYRLKSLNNKWKDFNYS